MAPDPQRAADELMAAGIAVSFAYELDGVVYDIHLRASKELPLEDEGWATQFPGGVPVTDLRASLLVLAGGQSGSVPARGVVGEPHV